MNVQGYLEEVAGGLSAEAFNAAHPHFVLVQVEGQPGDATDDAAVTERLDSQYIRRQAAGSRDAQVLALPRDAGPLVVGRSPQCPIHVEHVSVSKEHARFAFDGEKLTLEDLGSTNGTLVNNRRLEANVVTNVLPDDGIRFGKATGFHLMNPQGFYQYLQLLRRFGL